MRAFQVVLTGINQFAAIELEVGIFERDLHRRCAETVAIHPASGVIGQSGV